MMTCKICSHADRAAIDKALVENRSLRDVAGQHDVSRSALDRHKKHIPKELTNAKQAETVAAASTLLSRVEKLAGRCETIFERAAAAGNWSGAAAASREMRGCLELLGKLSGELQSAGARVAINFGDITKVDIASLSEEQVRALYGRLQDDVKRMTDEELEAAISEYLPSSRVGTKVQEVPFFDEETVPAPAGGNDVCWDIRGGKALKWTPYRNSSPTDRAHMVCAAWKRITGLELRIGPQELGPKAAIVLEFDLRDPREESWHTWPQVRLTTG